MLETLLSTIGVAFSPMISEMYAPGGLILGKLMLALVITLITLVSNIIRAFRFCDDEKGSYGIWYGILKGLVCAAIAVGGSVAIGFVPMLRVPFTVISVIPGLGSMVDGFILAVLYLISYMFIAYPIWGSC